jgi:hypothetical protein
MANMVRSRDTQGHPAAGAVKRRGLLERLKSARKRGWSERIFALCGRYGLVVDYLL